MRHTKEPWKTHSIWEPLIGRSRIWIKTSDGSNGQICIIESGNMELDIENAHRIVECVNACKGINPKAVPDILKALDEAHSEMCQMLSANEPGGACDKALRAAIKRAENAMEKAKK